MCNQWMSLFIYISQNKCRELSKNCYKLTASLSVVFTGYDAHTVHEYVCEENIVVNVAYDLFDGIYELSQVVIIFLFSLSLSLVAVADFLCSFEIKEDRSVCLWKNFNTVS